MKVYFGMYYQVYGTVGFDVPDELKDATDEEIQGYIRKHWDEVPLPSGDYVPDSDEPDFENFEVEK